MSFPAFGVPAGLPDVLMDTTDADPITGFTPSSGAGNAAATTLTGRYDDPVYNKAAWDFISSIGPVSGMEETKYDPVSGMEETKYDPNDFGGYLFQFDPTFKLSESPRLSLDDLFSGLSRQLLSDAEVTAEVTAEAIKTLGELDTLRTFWATEAKLPKNQVTITDAIIRPYEAVFKEFGDKRVFVQKNYFELNRAWRVIQGLSRLVAYPSVMTLLVDRSTKLQDFNDHLLFAFAARNILARTAFHTVVNFAVLKALATVGNDDSEYRWRSNGSNSVFDTFTILGFNRLFSPKNRVGISLSSDLDYKLVFKADNIVTKDGTGLSEEQKKEFVTKLNQAQKNLKDDFDNKAGMLLEVEGFTTREILALEKDLEEEDAEKNFLASIYHNNVRITGSPDLYNDFTKILVTYKSESERKNTEEFIIAKRTWTQYLGETDKGSMTVIQHLEAMKEMLIKCAPTLVGIVSNDGALNRYIMEETGTDLLNLNKNRKFNTVNIKTEKERWVASPKVLKLILQKGGKKAKSTLDNNNTVKYAVEKLDIFQIDAEGIKSPTDVLKRVAKVLSCLIDEDYVFRADAVVGEKISLMYDPSFADTCLKQIGSTLVADELVKNGEWLAGEWRSVKNGEWVAGEWRFSLKFCACRLNDFFDSVPLEEYLIWNTSPSGTLIYNMTNKVAVAVNKFALQMQNKVYLLASNSEGSVKATHVQIDSLYARITRSHFMEMLSRRDVVGLDIRPEMRELIATLLELKSNFNGGKAGIVARAIDSLVEWTNNAFENEDKQVELQAEANDPIPTTRNSTLIGRKEFFEKLFDVSMATSKLLYVE